MAAAAVLGLLVAGPIPQDPEYHNFADRRTLLGIPHALNVVSNLPFALAGILGLVRLKKSPERPAYFVFFVGVALVSLGSAWYHLSPSSPRLFWDRLPMAVAFMGLLAAVLKERVGRSFLIPLVAAGALGPLVWIWSGDLRLYAFVQYFPAAAIPALILLYPPRYNRTADFFIALGGYGLAKAFELLDKPVYDLGHVVSGHTVKHLCGAASAYWIARMLHRRRLVD